MRKTLRALQDKALRGAAGAAVVAAVIVAGGVAGAGVADAGPYRQGCSAWVHTTSPWTGGGTAVCTGGPRSVAWRVTVLCKHKYNWHGGRFIDGPWTTTSHSFAGCGWNEVPLHARYSTR
ncbi:hypothetical protein [Actinomycetospora flava]|uniref:Secreted protein n=1 Tax=Actinomycetospora flava TaxID=3129232 RepID=A0ABU8M675_9PSEU